MPITVFRKDEAPKIEPFTQREKRAEEARLRAEAQRAIEAEKARATEEFEQREIAKAKAEFERQLVAKKAKAEQQFAKELATEKARLRTQYQTQAQLAEGRFGRQLPAAKQAYKREYAMKTGRQATPRQVSAFFAGDVAAFRSGQAASKEVFETKLSEWESGERAGYKKYQETTLPEWETTERTGFQSFREAELGRFETELLGWEVTETQKAEQVIQEQMRLWKPKGLAERMLEISPEVFHFPDWTDVLRQQLFGIKPPTTKKVLSLPAGLVGSIESFVYSVGTLAGVKGLPSPPSTLSGGLLSQGIKDLGETTGLWTAHWADVDFTKKDPEYYFGSLLGDIILAYAGGQILKQAGKPVRYVAGKAAAPIKSAWRGSALDKFLFERSAWYVRKTGDLPKGLVSIPKTTGTKALGLKELKYSQAAAQAFDLTGSAGLSGYIPYPKPDELARAARSTMGVQILKPWLKPTIPAVTIQAGKISGISLGDSLKNLETFLKSTKASSSVSQLLEVPQKTFAALPKLAILPEIGLRAAAAYPNIWESAAFVSIMGVRSAPKSPTKPREDVWSGVSLASVNIAKVKVSIKQVPVQAAKQKTAQITSQASILTFMFGFNVPSPPSQLGSFMPPRREDLALKGKRRRARKRETGFRAGTLHYELESITTFLKTVAG